VRGVDGGPTCAKYNDPVNDSETLELFSGVSGVKELNLVESGVQGEDLRHLTRVRWITRLWLNADQFTESGIAHLQQLSNLRALVLWGAEIDDERLQLLRQLPNLQSLMLSKTSISGEGL